MLSSYPDDKIVAACAKCGLRKRFDKAAMLKAGGDRPLGVLLDDIAIRANCPKRKETPDIYDKMWHPLSGVGGSHEGGRALWVAMTRRTFANELEQAADAIADISRADLQMLLRRAAVRLRNTDGLTLDPDVDQAVDLLAAALKMPRSEVLQTIIRDWLTSGGRLRADTLNEDSDTDGTA